MKTQKLVAGRYELYVDGIFFSRKKTGGAYKGVEIEEDLKTIRISVGESVLDFPLEELLLHRGVHKAVYNKIAPWVERELNGKV